MQMWALRIASRVLSSGVSNYRQQHRKTLRLVWSWWSCKHSWFRLSTETFVKGIGKAENACQNIVFKLIMHLSWKLISNYRNQMSGFFALQILLVKGVIPGLALVSILRECWEEILKKEILKHKVRTCESCQRKWEHSPNTSTFKGVYSQPIIPCKSDISTKFRNTLTTLPSSQWQETATFIL